jgi:hypothetical protein
MYLFGYGNFVSTTNDLGLTVNKHLSVNAGYSLGSRLVVMGWKPGFRPEDRCKTAVIDDGPA